MKASAVLLSVASAFGSSKILEKKTLLNEANVKMSTPSLKLRSLAQLADDDASCNACDSHSFSTCFAGDTTYGACEICGFYANGGDALGNSDCISCQDGYEIDVVYDDCTGYCVPTGTATSPLGTSTCEMPCAACGTIYDGYVTTKDQNDDDDGNTCFHESTIITYKEMDYTFEELLTGAEPECVVVHTLVSRGVVLKTSCGKTVRVTDTHLMLTPTGYHPAASLLKGDTLFDSNDNACTVSSNDREIAEQKYFGLNCLVSEVHANGLQASTFGDFHTLPSWYMSVVGQTLGVQTASKMGDVIADFYYKMAS
jgi:hypothetical protein